MRQRFRKPDWWWACLRAQFPRFSHWPGPAIMAGGVYCGTCLPWRCCGAAGWEHKADCPEEAAEAERWAAKTEEEKAEAMRPTVTFVDEYGELVTQFFDEWAAER